MNLESQLQKRSNNACELCLSSTPLSLYETPYAPHHDEDGCVMICTKCSDQLEKKKNWTVHTGHA